MQVAISIDESPGGDVMLGISSSGMESATHKEAILAHSILILLKRDAPKLAKAVGAKNSIHGTGPIENG